jgi:hypothetical protein
MRNQFLTLFDINVCQILTLSITRRNHRIFHLSISMWAPNVLYVAILNAGKRLVYNSFEQIYLTYIVIICHSFLFLSLVLFITLCIRSITNNRNTYIIDKIELRISIIKLASLISQLSSFFWRFISVDFLSLHLFKIIILTIQLFIKNYQYIYIL